MVSEGECDGKGASRKAPTPILTLTFTLTLTLTLLLIKRLYQPMLDWCDQQQVTLTPDPIPGPNLEMGLEGIHGHVARRLTPGDFICKVLRYADIGGCV